MEIPAPAKINLHLRVGPPREDGFHPLLTWMSTLSLFDTLSISQNPTPNELRFSCSDASIPGDDRNLVIKAAKLLRQSAEKSVTIHLEKKIPHGGGLGGGSSDAASTLTALNQFWNLKKTPEQLHQLAAELGSDIPFFLHGPSSICEGRGELVRPIAPVQIAKWVVLILPAISMPTPAVYRQFDKMGLGTDLSIHAQPAWDQCTLLPATELLPKLVNDLEAPAFAISPALAYRRTYSEELLGRPVRMSGSGSSLFTLYDDHKSAAQAAHKVISHLNERAIAVELT